MFYSSKRRGHVSTPKPANRVRARKAIQNAIEPLETRVLMSTTTVTVTGLGDGAGLVTASGLNTYTATDLRAAVVFCNAHPFNSVINFSTTGTIKLTKALTLNNASHTYTITGPTGAKPIIIDGGGKVTDFIATAGVTAAFNNLTIQHGFATVGYNGGLIDPSGGGITSDGVLTINNVNFIGNTATPTGINGNESGGAVFSDTGSLTITGGSFVGNNAAYGGAVYTLDNSTNESPTITNATFTANTATFNGAAIENDSFFNSIFTLQGDTFTSNASVNFAPVSSISEPGGGTLTTNVNSCTFTNNSSGIGGALFTGSFNPGSQNTTLNVINSSFTGNKANGAFGGGIYSDDFQVSISGSTFASNLATTGSGIFLDGSSKTVSITGSSFSNAQGTPVVDFSPIDVVTASGDTFASNSGVFGGGIYAAGKSLTVSSSTFTNDNATAGSNGGGIWFIGAAGSSLTIDDALKTGSTFSNDSTITGNGGAVFSDAATNTISNTTFTGNSADKGNGGAVDINGLATEVATFSGNTFTGNQAVGNFGGAIFDGGGATATLTVGDTFTNNIAKKGGAIDSVGGAASTATINGSFTGNTATTAGGGAIFSNDNTLNVSGTFSGNQALNANGGAIADIGANLNLTASKFSNDLANGNGGGVYFNGVTDKITGTTFTGETAASGGNGGGAWLKANASTLTTDTFTNDSANNTGGGVFANTSGRLDISESTLNGDTAVNGGGGLYSTEPAAGGSLITIFNSTFNSDATSFLGGGGANVSNDTVTIANTTWSGNSAGNDVGGGGLALINSTAASNATITDSTFSLNTAGLKLGGGINTVAPTILDGDIVAGNYATGDKSTGNDIKGAVKGKFNLIGDNTDETGIGVNSVNNIVGDAQNPIDPLLAPLANNGGQTYTMEPLPGSPAIGNGGPFVVPNVNGINITANDQIGNPRPTFPQGWDIGAVQTQGTPTVSDVLSFVTVPATATVGVPATVTIEATLNGTLDSAFSDTVSFSSTDAAATGLPQNVTFVNGELTFSPTFNTVGNQKITATDDNAASNVASVTSTTIVVSKVAPVSPVASIATPAPITKPSSGTVPYNFTVTLSGASASATTIHYMTLAGSASAGAGDYVGVPSGTLVIPAGQLSGTITITVNGNTKVNPPRTFTVELTSISSNATLGTSTATGTILSGVVGVTPVASILTPAPIAPNSVGQTPYNFTVQLSVPAASTVTIYYMTVGGTASAGDGDYTGIPNGVLTIPAGSSSGTITVLVNPTPEMTMEYFFVKLTSATGATIGTASAEGQIIT